MTEQDRRDPDNDDDALDTSNPEQEEDQQEVEDETEAGVDLGSRVLCPDGECIGVIGPDGRCKVCGTALDGSKPAAVGDDEQGDDEQGDDEQDDDDALDLKSRVLCSDGACIGVIGADGRCKECGKPYNGEPSDEEGDGSADA